MQTPICSLITKPQQGVLVTWSAVTTSGGRAPHKYELEWAKVGYTPNGRHTLVDVKWLSSKASREMSESGT